jgi:hypothetical protein
MSFNLVSAQPARQPEAISTGLKGNSNAFDGTSSLGCFLPQAMQKL